MDAEQIEQWFDEQYRRHAKKLIGTAYRILGNREAAEDVVQNVFLVMLAQQETVSRLDQPSFWIYKTLRNQIGNEMKRQKYRQAERLDEALDIASYDECFPDLRSQLPPGLSEADQEILSLCYEEQLSYAEIAERLGISALAAGARLSRARARCKKNYKKFEKDVKILSPQESIQVGGE